VTKSSVGVELIKVQYPYHLNTKANKEEWNFVICM
jgi:hypothetical protein